MSVKADKTTNQSNYLLLTPFLIFIWDGSPTAADTGLKILPVRVRIPLVLPLKMKGDISMKFKVKHYSTERLRSELDKARFRLAGYLDAREHMPITSILGSLAIASGIKYEEALIAALEEEYYARVHKADSSAAE